MPGGDPWYVYWEGRHGRSVWRVRCVAVGERVVVLATPLRPEPPGPSGTPEAERLASHVLSEQG